ncbi:MAG: glycosyltransferase [Acidobacteriaceae bacterium]|nr:glycosyltransferase [Acidobacteriaceae bacterium]
MSLYIDLTEFLANPITSGIQRIAGEICKHLPAGAGIPVRLHAGRYLVLSPTLMPLIGAYFNDASAPGAAEIRTLSAIERGVAIELSESDIVLVPEVFFDPQRVRFFQEMPEQQFRRCRFLIHDLLPLTHPEYFWPELLLDLYRYYRMLRDASCCGFTSQDTRNAYYGRLKRIDSCGGVMLRLGCDALGPRPQQPALNRPLTFSVLGTIEPRKNHKLILEAFEPLLGQIPGLTLSFIGRIGWVDSEFAQKVQSLAAEKGSGFRFESAKSDSAIRSYVEQSRATIYVSTAEGYGLPPVESLWAGTPVIASTASPSLRDLGTAGIHYVEPLTAANLTKAVLDFFDDSYANQKAEETTDLNLPTWHSFTQEVLEWCTGDCSDNQR